MPARYGGVETVVDVLARELVRRGHEVTVFCRRSDYTERPSHIDGVRLVYLRVPEISGLAALVHSLLATLWALPRRFDVYHYHALGPGLIAAVPRLLTRAMVVQTVHGRDDKRQKWGLVARTVLRLGALSSARIPHKTLVVSKALAKEYLDEFGRSTSVVPNAIAPADGVSDATEAPLGLEPSSFIVTVGRLVPEKAPHELISAYVASDIELPLVVVGGSSGTVDYAAELQRIAGDDDRIIFTGPLYGTDLLEVRGNARCFVTASHLEGLPTALIEAGTDGVPCLASDIDPHTEVLAAAPTERWLFRMGDEDHLVSQLKALIADDSAEAAAQVVADDLRLRFSIERAGDAHEMAYGVVAAPTDRAGSSNEVVIDLRDPPPAGVEAAAAQAEGRV